MFCVSLRLCFSRCCTLRPRVRRHAGDADSTEKSLQFNGSQSGVRNHFSKTFPGILKQQKSVLGFVEREFRGGIPRQIRRGFHRRNFILNFGRHIHSRRNETCGTLFFNYESEPQNASAFQVEIRFSRHVDFGRISFVTSFDPAARFEDCNPFFHLRKFCPNIKIKHQIHLQQHSHRVGGLFPALADFHVAIWKNIIRQKRVSLYINDVQLVASQKTAGPEKMNLSFLISIPKNV